MIKQSKLKVVMAASSFIAVMGLAGAASAEKLMLYTSQPDADAAATVAAFQAENPGVEVEVFRSGTSDLLGKLAAEFAAGSPQPDVLLIADALSMEGLKADSRLMAYPDANTEGFDPAAIDAEKFYFGSKLITTGIAYNVAATEAPKSWLDLTGPAYKDLVVMPSPLYSGAAAFMLSAFTERDDMGWDYFNQMQANGLLAVRGNGAVLKSVATGEKAYGILVDFLAMNAIRDGSPIKFVFPEEGVTAVTEPVAIMATAKNVDGAKKFIDFILSDAGQNLALSQGYLPAKASVGRPAWLDDGVNVKVMDVNIGAITSKVEGNKQQFSTLFGG